MIRLSYALKPTSPLYPGTPPLATNLYRSLENGDASNHSVASVSCHAGTHIDSPLHFCQNGASVQQILSYGMTFCPAYCWDLPRDVNQQITVQDLRVIDHGRYRDAQAVLIRTGFWRMRDIAGEDYTQRNPVVDPKVATFLRSRYPALRLVGIDTISIANPGHKDAGRACHREFLCNDPPVLILEDVDLSDDRLLRGSFELILYPMIIGKIEATPVVALAEPIPTMGEKR